MATNKPLNLDQFENLIDAIEFQDITKFSKYDPSTKKRVESNNGRKVDLKTQDGKLIKMQPVSKLDEALKCRFGASQYIDTETGKESWTITVTPEKTSRVFAVLRKFDERVLNEGKKHHEWFREAGWKARAVNDDNIATNFLSSLKEPEPDKLTGEIKYTDFQWKMTFFPKNLHVCIKDEDSGVFKNHQKDGHLHIHNVHCDIMPSCTPSYVWFTGNQWGVKWYVNMVVVPKVYTNATTADFSSMLGMEGIEIVSVEESAKVDDTTNETPEDDECVPPMAKKARPTLLPPSIEDVSNLFEQS
jgi:hypothetical protein